jgi:hypothetical protein
MNLPPGDPTCLGTRLFPGATDAAAVGLAIVEGTADVSIPLTNTKLAVYADIVTRVKGI